MVNVFSYQTIIYWIKSLLFYSYYYLLEGESDSHG